MANSYTSIFFHVIFSTRNRDRVLISNMRDRLWAYMGGIARENKMRALSVGGTLDHSHILLSLTATIAISKAVQLIKSGSSKWIHDNFSPLQNFAWQEGYAAFSIGSAQVNDVSTYIAGQVEHHRTKSFQEEYLGFLKEHGIPIDERFLWG